MRNLSFMRMMGFMILSLVLFSCDNELHMYLPQGPEGEKGENGLSAYEVWVKEVLDGNIDWDKNHTDTNNFFLYLKGEDGKDGQNGQDGQNGKSAYEIWVEEVAKGLEDPHNPGQMWPKDETDLNDFWYYLTGADGQDGKTPSVGDNGNWWIGDKDTGIPVRGQDGQNGQDGQDGQDGKDGSLVTIGDNGNWYIDGKDTGVPAYGQNGKDGQNGQNGQNGQDGQNGQNGQDGQDGKDGQNGKSAYELWVEEVAKGLEDPHNPGQEWPKDQTTTQDFWYYLRGEDGKDGQDGKDGAPGEIGKPGETVTIIKGKPNVISQYESQEFSEFVRWSDGGVAFIVYDDEGSVAPGAKVKGLPGLDPNKVYVADGNGVFIVPKEDLPLDKPSSDRFGSTAEVEYVKSTGETVTEVSAPNTYVPNKVQVRINIIATPTITADHIKISCRVERKTDPARAWESIPTYLGGLTQKIVAYELSDPNDPASYTASSAVYFTGNRNISKELSIDNAIPTDGDLLRVARHVKQSKYITGYTYLWDGNDHYFNLVLESYYGEKPYTSTVIKMAPVQYMPIVKDLEAYDYNSTLNLFNYIEGKFDIADANIDYNLVFKSTPNTQVKTVGGNTFTYYSPIVESKAVVDNASTFTIVFFVAENSANNDSNRASVSSPSFKVNTPYLGSKVYIKSTEYPYFKSPTNDVKILGTLERDGTVLKIKGNTETGYNFPDIIVTEH